MIVRTSHSTLLLSIVSNMGHRSVLIAMIVSFALATDINKGIPSDFLKFARLPGVYVRAFDNNTRGWNKTKWEDLESYKTVKVCEDADTFCESEVR